MATDRQDDAPEVGLLEAFWRYRWSSLVLIVLSGALAALSTMFVFTTVDATARFAVTDPRSTVHLRQGVASDSSYIAYTAQRAAFAESAGVLTKAQQLLAAEQALQIDLEDLREAVSAKPGTSGGIIEVTASAKSDKRAALIANAVVAAYQQLTEADARRDQEKLLRSVRTAQTRITTELKKLPPSSATALSLSEALVQLQLKESEASVDLTQFGTGVRFVDQANPLRLTPSQLPKNLALGVAVGILAAVVIAFLRATNPIATVQRVTMPVGQRHRPAKQRSLNMAAKPATTPAAPVAEAVPEPPLPPPRTPQPSASTPVARPATPPSYDDDPDTAVFNRDELLSALADDEEKGSRAEKAAR